MSVSEVRASLPISLFVLPSCSSILTFDDMADQVIEEYMQPRELSEEELWMAWGKFGKLPADILYDLDEYVIIQFDFHSDYS